jgi:hypothetical protein
MLTVCDPPFVKRTVVDAPHLHQLSVTDCQELDTLGGEHEAYYDLWK